MGKRKIGEIYNKPIIEGDINLKGPNEIHKSELSGGGSNNELETILDEQYDYYCMEKIIGLAEDGRGNVPYSDFIVEKINYTDNDLENIKNFRLTIIAAISLSDYNILLCDNLVIEAWFEKYTKEVCVNKIPNKDSHIDILYIKCRKVSKYATGFPIPDEIIGILPEYISIAGIFSALEGKEVPLIKITAEDYYKGQYFINKSKAIN